jgi:phage terminase small subunit
VGRDLHAEQVRGHDAKSSSAAPSTAYRRSPSPASRGRTQGLTERQRRFVEEYLVDLNGKEAAMRAGYAPGSAKKSAWNNFAKPAIAAAIAERQGERLEAIAMRAEEVIRELSAIARANILDHLRPGSDGRPIVEIDADAAAGLCEVTVEHFTEGSGEEQRSGRRIRIRMQDKLSALDRLAKHYGLYCERISHEAPEGSAIMTPEDRETVTAVLALISEGQADGER